MRLQHPRLGFNPWYVGGGVKSSPLRAAPKAAPAVSILGMLEGVLKDPQALLPDPPGRVSILGMLEGVLKGYTDSSRCERRRSVSILGMLEGVLKGVLSCFWDARQRSFNPWYVGGGVKSNYFLMLHSRPITFQSLVCWRGC